MFGNFKKEEHKDLDEVIARILREMDVYGPDSEEFPPLLAHLEKLYRLRAETRRHRISLDTMVTTGGTIVVALIIVSYEHMHVIASKAVTLLKSK